MPHPLRILVISDVHGNINALDAVLAAAGDCDEVWNLGDVVGYNAAPNETVERAREVSTAIVRGNHDRACTDVAEADRFNSVAALAARWTAQHLSAENAEWLRQLPSGPIQPFAELDAQIVHGSPRDEDTYLLSALQAARELQYCATQITFFGHSHVQGGFACEEGACAQITPQFEPMRSAPYVLRLRRGAKYLINPGSVGQPRDGDPRSAFCIWEPQRETVTFFRVSYDVAQAQERIRNAGLPEMLAARLALGR